MEGPKLTYRVMAYKDAMISMRDGIKLAVNIYRSSADDRIPALLAWDMWGKDDQEVVF